MNFAELSTKSLRPLINISFAKIVGIAQYQKKFPDNLFVNLILRLTIVVRSIFP